MARTKKVQSTTTSPSAINSTSPQIKTTQRGSSPKVQSGSILTNINTRKAIILVVLAAIYSPLSQLVLAPVFGSIPSASHHKYGVICSALLAYALRGTLPVWTDRLLPAFAFWIPSIQFGLFMYSTALGNPLGPLVTEMLTTFPLITLSMYAASSYCDALDLSFVSSNPNIVDSVTPMSLYIVYMLVQRLFKTSLPNYMGSFFPFTRVGLQLTIATFYGLTLPQSTFWPALPSIAFTMIANPHTQLQRTTAVLNNTLALYDYTLLDRHESLTGYISVLQDNKNEFRVMRCDHSLLGGEWLVPSSSPTAKFNSPVGEPIYAVFTMLEAVRLIEPPPKTATIPDTSKSALVVGLGIGTAPSALIAHGIRTTILELDPTIHTFATKYFRLPSNHSAIIGDAASFVHTRANALPLSSDPEHQSGQYDLLIHDTFTGGALPIDLFTHEFLTSLSLLMKPHAAIAINYAGDLTMPSASLVYRTITSVFPACRLFREDKEETSSSSSPSSSSTSADSKPDFTNLVYFCLSPSRTPTPDSHALKFRTPVPADYLNSPSRKLYMLPKHEVDAQTKFGRGAREGRVLSRRDRASIKEIERWQERSAIGHWELMRGVIRREVWENW